MHGHSHIPAEKRGTAAGWLLVGWIIGTAAAAATAGWLHAERRGFMGKVALDEAKLLLDDGWLGGSSADVGWMTSDEEGCMADRVDIFNVCRRAGNARDHDTPLLGADAGWLDKKALLPLLDGCWTCARKGGSAAAWLTG